MEIDEKEILFKKFKILKCYKKDEFSAVYLADHIYLEKQVFLKILDTHSIPDPDIIERFKREARILAKLDHPNVIKVYDFGTYKDFFYISFEYFESQNLRQFMLKRSMEEADKKEIVAQLLKGLHYIHSKNILHRDIKPENILVNENIHLKLTDFGLAQISNDQTITKKFAVVGTPAYMSPEQIHGQALTAESDLFSLGITIFELFSGKNLFMGNNSNETISNILSFNESQIQESLNDFPSDISEILKNLLVADSDKRTAKIEDLFNILGIDQKNIETQKENSGKFKILLPIIIIIGSIGLFFLIYEFENENPELLNNPKVDNKQYTISDNIDDSNSNDIQVPVENSSSVLPEEEIETVKTKNELKSEIMNPDVEIEDPIIEMGELHIDCYPWAQVHINNKYIETTPMNQNIKLDPGNYRVTLKHPDYPDYHDSIAIASSEIYNMEINLDTLLGFFSCLVYPWSEVYINGEMKGVTPLKSPIALFPGEYDLELKNPDYPTYSSKISVLKNDTIFYKFNFEELRNN